MIAETRERRLRQEDILLSFLGGGGWKTLEGIRNNTPLGDEMSDKELRTFLWNLDAAGVIKCHTNHKRYRYSLVHPVGVMPAKSQRRNEKYDRVQRAIGHRWCTLREIKDTLGLGGSDEALRQILQEMVTEGHLDCSRDQTPHLFRSVNEEHVEPPSRNLTPRHQQILEFMGTGWHTTQEVAAGIGYPAKGRGSIYKVLTTMLDAGLLERDASVVPYKFRRVAH